MVTHGETGKTGLRIAVRCFEHCNKESNIPGLHVSIYSEEGQTRRPGQVCRAD